MLCVHFFFEWDRKCFWQCLLLACPGVLLGTFLTAAVGKYVLPYGWDWNVAMAFGSILAATDPVAVVSILNELGASPKLTMLISGESLMNDGTAIVVYSLFNALAQGDLTLIGLPAAQAVPTAGDVVGYFARVALGGPLVGFVCGLVTVWWPVKDFFAGHFFSAGGTWILIPAECSAALLDTGCVAG